MNSKCCQIRPQTAELAGLERLEKSPYTYMYKGSNVVTVLAPPFLIGSNQGGGIM